MKIELQFKTKIDLDFLSAGISVRLIRVLTDVRFQTNNGWTDKYKAIIDTGSPVSVIPLFIWENIQVKWLLSKKEELFGIGSSSVSGRLAEITSTFSDEKHISQPITFKAHLLDTNSVPLLIGFEDVLTSIKLSCDYKSQRAYLEW
jgi:hypothetical protein